MATAAKLSVSLLFFRACGRVEISEFGSKLQKRTAAFWSARSTCWRIGVMRTDLKMQEQLVQGITVAAVVRQQTSRPAV